MRLKFVEFLVLLQLICASAWGQTSTTINNSDSASRAFYTVLLVKGKYIPAVITLQDQNFSARGVNTSEFAEISAAYTDVLMVRIFRANAPLSNQLFHVLIRLRDGNLINAGFEKETDARALGDSVGRLTDLKSISGSYYQPKIFYCPEVNLPGCSDFRELLDHEDSEISDYFYSKTSRDPTFACFGDDRTFFIVFYTKVDGKDAGIFFYKKFDHGQSVEDFAGSILWAEKYGQINSYPEQGKKAKAAGDISPTELNFSRQFENRVGTTTTDVISIRWSTLHYKESMFWKDDDGKPTSIDLIGSCLRLNTNK